MEEMEMEAEDNGTYLLHAEGLFGWSTHRLQVDVNGVQAWVLDGHEPPAPDGPVDQSASEGPGCDGQTGVMDGLNGSLAWCGGSDRLIGWDLEDNTVVEILCGFHEIVDGFAEGVCRL